MPSPSSDAKVGSFPDVHAPLVAITHVVCIGGSCGVLAATPSGFAPGRIAT